MSKNEACFVRHFCVFSLICLKSTFRIQTVDSRRNKNSCTEICLIMKKHEN